MGIVSGLTSLKNSIMIPAMSSTAHRTERTKGSQASSLTASQSSLLDFVDEDQPPLQSHRHQSMLLSRPESPGLLRSRFLKTANDLGSGSLMLERKNNDSRKESRDSRVARTNTHHSTFGITSEHRSTSSMSTTSQRYSSSRGHVSSSNSATHSLSLLETEFQQLIMKQGQLSAHKIELCKELLSLYSRRNTNEQRQEEATRTEQFEEADVAATTIRLIHERVQKVEGAYMETDRALWKSKKRQDELSRQIADMQQAVMHEMDQMRQERETEKGVRRMELQRVRESEMERIQGERDEVEKEKSDIALGQDFLGKNEAELLERMEEETKTEQDEMDDLIEKRNATRTEIKELTRKLEQLRNQDKEYGRSINILQGKIAVIAQQFDGLAKEVSREKRGLERRMTEVQAKTQHLDHQESSVLKAVHEAEATQEEIASEIHQINLQRDRLEEVRRLFEGEQAMIQKLRLEEEEFREKEAGWNMRASSLGEGLKKYESQIEAWTNQSVTDQKAITNLELDLDATKKRISTVETLKTLSIQRRDFKQASQCSAELAKCRETIAQQQTELDNLTSKMNGQAQKQLKSLEKEYEDAKALAKSEEDTLFKEIQTATTEALDRINALTSDTAEEQKDSHDAAMNGASAERPDDSKTRTVSSSTGQLSRRLLNEMRSEIENVCAIARIRFGREEPVYVVSSQSTGNLSSGSNAALKTDSVESVQEQRQRLERDIEAAVAEEDYDAAGNMSF
ncbi:hypothetical protein BGZ54_005206 [Gamsiella multidivaricata]|nr:hypothetical protein BGZ54_005206 [Gamsiella multidivaricata]